MAIGAFECVRLTFPRRARWWVSSTIGLLAVLAGCSWRPDTRITDQDFANDQQRMDFVKDYVPFEIPASTRDVRFVFVSWLDWTLDLSFVVSKDDCETLRSRLTERPMNNSGEFVVRDEERGIEAIVRLSSESRTVWVESHNSAAPETSGGSMEPIVPGEPSCCGPATVR